MKGIVFTEFIEMVESLFSPEVADDIIEAADLPSGGVYSSLGTYDHTEIVKLAVELSRVTGVALPELIKTFGKHLFGRFFQLYPMFFDGSNTAFEFLVKIEGYIHVEVKKLYPDAELPSFDTSFPSPDQLLLLYKSERKFADLAEGLIVSCIAHFGDPIQLAREDKSNDGSEVLFILTREASNGD